MRDGMLRDDAEHFVFYEDEFFWGFAIQVTFDGLALQGEGAYVIFRDARGDFEAVADFAVYLDYYCDHLVADQIWIEGWPRFKVN